MLHGRWKQVVGEDFNGESRYVSINELKDWAS
jgi:hypothetical protein